MIKFDMYNPIFKTTYKNVVFTNFDQITNKKVINLIYASNASGKSSFAKILEMHISNDDNRRFKNSFDNEEAMVSITQNNNNINSVFKYDRKFAEDSVELYQQKLLIIPEDSKALVETLELIQKKEPALIESYKKSDYYSKFKLMKDHILDELKLISKSRFSKTDPHDFYNLIKDEVTENCTSLTIEELIDFGYSNTTFLDDLVNSFSQLNKEILLIFPEIDRIDYDFFSSLVRYLENHGERLVGKNCVLCGVTFFTNEIRENQLIKLRKSLKDFDDVSNTNSLISKLNDFLEYNFQSPLLKGYQDILRGKVKNDLFQSLFIVYDSLQKIDLKSITSNAKNCIIQKIRTLPKIHDLLAELRLLNLKKAEYEEKNRKSINSNVVSKFKETLRYLNFRYIDQIEIVISEEGILTISFVDIDISDVYNSVLSESEKSILSFALFLSIIDHKKSSLVIIDDPIDSHDQKNKWFIMNKILESFNTTDSTVLIFTHDLDISKNMLNLSDQVQFENYLLSSVALTKVDSVSLYFSNVIDFAYSIIELVNKSILPTSIYIFPVGLLLRYLSKYQYKMFVEVNSLLAPGQCNNLITRREVKKIGFETLSDQFVHYKASINSDSMMNDLQRILKIKPHNGLNPPFIKTSIATDDLISYIITNLGTTPQYNHDLTKIMKSLLIRNTIEKKILAKITITSETTFAEFINNYVGVYGIYDPLYIFYQSTKSMLDELAHLESGVDALLTYDMNYIDVQLTKIMSL